MMPKFSMRKISHLRLARPQLDLKEPVGVLTRDWLMPPYKFHIWLDMFLRSSLTAWTHLLRVCTLRVESQLEEWLGLKPSSVFTVYRHNFILQFVLQVNWIAFWYYNGIKIGMLHAKKGRDGWTESRILGVGRTVAENNIAFFFGCGGPLEGSNELNSSNISKSNLAKDITEYPLICIQP